MQSYELVEVYTNAYRITLNINRNVQNTHTHRTHTAYASTSTLQMYAVVEINTLVAMTIVTMPELVFLLC